MHRERENRKTLQSEDSIEIILVRREERGEGGEVAVFIGKRGKEGENRRKEHSTLSLFVYAFGIFYLSSFLQLKKDLPFNLM